MKFPKEVVVTQGADGEEDEFLIIHESIEDADDIFPKGKVGIYELKEVQQVNWVYERKVVKNQGGDA